jgi:hypothetical protein
MKTATGLINNLKKTMDVCGERITKLKALRKYEELQKDIANLMTGDDPNNFNSYIKLREQVKACDDKDPNSQVIKVKLSNWETNNKTWINIWEFINTCRRYIQGIDKDDLKKTREEINNDQKSLDSTELQKYPKLSKLVNEEYMKLIDLIDKKEKY